MKLTSIQFEGIDYLDYPEACSLVITYAIDEHGNKLTEEQLKEINNDKKFVRELIKDRLF